MANTIEFSSHEFSSPACFLLACLLAVPLCLQDKRQHTDNNGRHALREITRHLYILIFDLRDEDDDVHASGIRG